MMRRFLDVSSGHLTPETWTWLDEQFDEGALRNPGHRIAGRLGGYDRAQAKWGDKRRAFVTGEVPKPTRRRRVA